MKKIIIQISIVAVTLLILLFNMFIVVPTGYVGVKTIWGKVQEGIAPEGLNVKIPLVEKIVKMDCRIQKVEVINGAASKDLQSVLFNIAVNYSVDPEKANTLYKEIGTGYVDTIIQPAILESIKATTAKYTAEELITKRGEVSNIMAETLSEKISERGIRVIEFNVIDLDFSNEFNRAIENKQIAEQQTKQAQYELERVRVENEKKVETAKADAEVARQQSSTVTELTIRLKALENQEKLISKWNGAFPSTMLSDSINSLFNINN